MPLQTGGVREGLGLVSHLLARCCCGNQLQHSHFIQYNNTMQGIIELSAEKDPTLFKLARVALGMLGVVTELTLQVSQQRGDVAIGGTAEAVCAKCVLCWACWVW